MEEGLIVKLAIGALVPGFAATGILGAAWWRWRRSPTLLAESPGTSVIEHQGEPFWIMPALTAALAAAMIPIISEATLFPPVSGSEWLPFIAIAAGALELATRGPRFPDLLKWALRAAFFALTAAACAKNMLTGPWSAATSATWIAGFAAIALAATAILEAVLARTRAFTAPALLLIIAGGTSQILVIGYSNLKIGQAVGVIAAVLGAACVISILRPRFSLAFGGSFVAIAIAAASLFRCDITADDRLVHAGRVFHYTALIASAAILPGLSLIRPFSTLEGWKRSIMLFLLAGAPIAASLAIAAYDERHHPATDYESLARLVAHYL